MQFDYDAIKNMVDSAQKQKSGFADSACQSSVACSSDGIYYQPAQAVKAAAAGAKALSKITLEQRSEFIDAIRKKARAHAQELARIEVDETTMGRYENKVTKIVLTADKTPGIDDIKPRAYVGDFGLTVEEHLPYGVALCITPSTAPCTTPIGNAICMIAAGNSTIFCPHPAAIKSTVRTVQIINEAITSVGGPPNLISCMGKSTIAFTDELIAHPDVKLLVATGGPSIAKKLMSSGKKAISAGDGNPPALVDDTADIVNAARCVLAGNYFENGIQCIAEKGIIVLEGAAERLIEELTNQGAFLIHDRATIERLTKLVTMPDGTQNKAYLGKDPAVILKGLGIEVPADTKSIIYEVDRSHPTFMEEYLMPLIPIVRAKSIGEAIEISVDMEHGRHHTAVIHSKNVTNLSDFVRAMACTIMVKNGPSYAGLGLGGEGTSAVTVSSPTGEGITSPVTFTRMARCVLVGEFNLRSSSI